MKPTIIPNLSEDSENMPVHESLWYEKIADLCLNIVQAETFLRNLLYVKRCIPGLDGTYDIARSRTVEAMRISASENWKRLIEGTDDVYT